MAHYRLIRDFLAAMLKEFVLWVFIGLDFVGLIIQYAPLISSRPTTIAIPVAIYIALPMIGIIWASFRVYSAVRFFDDPKLRQLERDRVILGEFMDLLPSSGSISWLRDYDFSSTFDVEWLSQIHDFENRCRRPEFEFIDEELETLKLDLLTKCEEFSDLIGQETFPVHIPNRRLNRIPEEMSYQDPEKFRSIRKRINDSASALVNAFDNLVKKARRKL